MELSEYTRIFVGLLAIVNPFGAIPVFLGLVGDRSPAEQRRTARVSSATAALVMIISLVGGVQILSAFGIGIPAFRMAGGVLIFSMALSMMQGKQSDARHTEEEHEDARTRESVAVVPLAIPLLAGPGTMSTVIVYGHNNQGLASHVAIALASALVCALVFVAFRFAERLAKLLGKTGLNVMSRVMGLLLLAIAIEFITKGLAATFPGWTITGVDG